LTAMGEMKQERQSNAVVPAIESNNGIEVRRVHCIFFTSIRLNIFMSYIECTDFEGVYFLLCRTKKK
jgi:hypothetical protein